MNGISVLAVVCVLLPGADDRLTPHNQDRPPGPALTPQEAMRRMRVPRGFQVRLFASEPDVVNPVAMTFDDRGRVWITESLDYPRAATGVGRDRIKILDDADRDGKVDKVTVFADGLNIPSGIALGHGGVFVANAPDLLFLRDTDGDDRADVRDVLLSGFGRSDTHELPSCLTWGPDGWLYGLNGVFNHSKIAHQGKTFSFNCALWRYHPHTKAFELFAEGTSNPWGLDYDQHGSFFVSACVIDHLWHLVESGYYHRQAGPYPPFTWKIESIVDHRHQKAAYCGLAYYDADAYPAEFRQTLMMGNIHGNCINSDSLERHGASYRAKQRPDLLAANDAWFMPVVQAVGPDGCVWIADWYDRYHCYQDANRDPGGIDRLKGRIYRITHQNTPMPPAFDLAKLTDAQLVRRLSDANVCIRRRARRLLVERGTATDLLTSTIRDVAAPQNARMEALWTLVSREPLSTELHAYLLASDDNDFRAWGVRATTGASDESIRQSALALVRDRAPEVRLQAVLAARKLCAAQASIPLLLDGLVNGSSDPSGVLPRIVWRGLEPLLPSQGPAFVGALKAHSDALHRTAPELLVRATERLAVVQEGDAAAFAAVVGCAIDSRSGDRSTAARSLETILELAISGQLSRQRLGEIKSRFAPVIRSFAAGSMNDPCTIPGLGLAIVFGDTERATRAIECIADSKLAATGRSLLLRTMIHASPQSVLEKLDQILPSARVPTDAFMLDVLAAMGRLDSPRVGERVIDYYSTISPQFRAQALDLLTSRPTWGHMLVAAVRDKRIAATDCNVNQLRKLLRFHDAELTQSVTSTWGNVRMDRSPDRDAVIDRMRRVIGGGAGKLANGRKVFEKVCAQCHKLHGAGSEVGPDLTGIGRSELEQLLSNLLDPNLVIGKDYQARIVATADGRVVTGLVAEDSAERVVLKVAGGKLEVFPRSEIEELKESAVSMMPEDLEKQVSDQEFRDLIALLRSER